MTKHKITRKNRIRKEKIKGKIEKSKNVAKKKKKQHLPLLQV